MIRRLYYFSPLNINLFLRAMRRYANRFCSASAHLSVDCVFICDDGAEAMRRWREGVAMLLSRKSVMHDTTHFLILRRKKREAFLLVRGS